MADFYNTIEKPGYAEFKDRGSKFLAYCFPVTDSNDFKKQLQKLKDEHPKAAHHCFAYRIGTDGNNFRSSDDGEPSGSAGKPILVQIDSKELTNVAVIVIRYFGGTLLGVPGLINAYKTATALALQTTPVIQKAIETNYRLQFDYTLMNEVMNIVKKYGCTIHRQETQLFCLLEIGVPKSRLNEVLYNFSNLYALEISSL
ncbi:MAG: YigZ family protein [Chitinophagaceae bacterium]